MRTWNFRTAGQIVFGAESSRRVGDLLQALGSRRSLLVTDKNLQSAAERILDGIASTGAECVVFDEGEAEPAVEVAQRVLRGLGDAVPDSVIGLGGGSNIDVAKAAALLLSHGGTLFDYAGQNRVPAPVLPIVAVPTTAGSGSEVSGACILNLPEENSKLGIVDNHLRPAAAVVDPELHVTCPPRVTRDAGIDAFCHAIEALTIVDFDKFPRDPADPWPLYQGKHPISDTMAERAVERIALNLPRVLNDPADLEARSRMAEGALLAGMAMSNTGIYTVHALTYPVGSFTRASHGACNGALLPAVLDFVEPMRQTECRRILELMGSERSRAGDAVRDFLAEISAPASLRELGLRPEQIQRTAEIGLGIKRLMNGSPRPTSMEEMIGIVESAYRG